MSRNDLDPIFFQVGEQDEGTVLNSFLRNRGLSHTLIRRLMREGQIRLNGKPAGLKEPVSAGDRVELLYPSEEAENLSPEEMELTVLHEDEDLLIVDKAPGIAVHPTLTIPSGTLANGVAAYWRKKGMRRKFRPVNRLDKNTSGIVVIAQNAIAQHALARQQQAGSFVKEYMALVHGRIGADEGEINAPIGLKAGSIIEREVRPDGQEARTRFRVLKRFPGMTWVAIRLLTGRTHQIRVHFAHIGHPLLGDDLYGGSKEPIGRQALHACYVRLIHPRTERLLEIRSPLPEDMQKVLDAAQGGRRCAGKERRFTTEPERKG